MPSIDFFSEDERRQLIELGQVMQQAFKKKSGQEGKAALKNMTPETKQLLCRWLMHCMSGGR